MTGPLGKKNGLFIEQVVFHNKKPDSCCPVCGKLFYKKRKEQRLCSRSCARKSYLIDRNEES